MNSGSHDHVVSHCLLMSYLENLTSKIDIMLYGILKA